MTSVFSTRYVQFRHSWPFVAIHTVTLQDLLVKEDHRHEYYATPSLKAIVAPQGFLNIDGCRPVQMV